MTLAECVAVLARLEPDITPEAMADIFWLATRMGPVGPRVQLTPKPDAPPVTPGSGGSQATIPVPPPNPTPDPAQPSPSLKDEDGYGLYALPQGDVPARGSPARLVRVAAAKPLRNAPALGRSLRLLKRRVPSRTDRVVDITATVDRIAENGQLAPVLRPARERWLDLAFVIDEGVSMRTWDTTLAALRRLLEHHGAFRRFHVWKLQADAGGMDLFLDASRSAKGRRPRPASELTDSWGRTLILVASDCVAEGWRNGTVLRQIMKWGEKGPVALLHMLPRRLWPATALGAATLSVHGREPGAANSRLLSRPLKASSWEALASRLGRVRKPEAGSRSASLLPVVNLEEWSLGAWSGVLAAKPGAVVTGIDLRQVVSRPREPLPPSSRASESIAGAERVQQFRHNASPTAFELACYLAETPLSLPVMRLVQEVMLPDSTQTHLAEFVLGGLTKAIPEPETGFHPDALMFEFYDGVAEELQSRVPGPDRNRVHAAVSGYLARREGRPQDFLAAEAEAGGPAMIDPLSKAFGRLKSRGAGGEWRPNRRWVLVAGTGRRNGLPDLVGKIAEGVGKRLALDGYSLLVGEWPGVDYLVAQSYVSTLRNLGVPVQGHLKQHAAVFSVPDFPAKSYGGEQVDRNGREYDNADAVILIGGEGSTGGIFERCMQLHRVVLPIAASGGDSAEAFASLASGQRDPAVDLRLLRYLSQAETPDAIVGRVATVLRVLHDRATGDLYRNWAARMFDLLARDIGHAESLYAAELSTVAVLPQTNRPGYVDDPPLDEMLPAAQEWLRYDFTRLTTLMSYDLCWRLLTILTPLVIKHLRDEAQTLLRAVCATPVNRDDGELLTASPALIEAAELDVLLQRLFGLTRAQFALLLRLWRFVDVPAESRREQMKQHLPPPTVEDLLPLLTNSDRINRHLAWSAFCEYPVHDAADSLAKALALDVASLEGLTPLWAECVRVGLDFEPLAYLNQPVIDKALRDAATYVTSGRDPGGGWSALLALANEFKPETPSSRPITHLHILALYFVFHHLLAREEWQILQDLSAGREVKVGGSDFRSTIRRLRDRRLVQGGRVSALERGTDLAKSFSLTENGWLCLAARRRGEAGPWTDAQIAGLLLFNLISTPERVNLRKLGAAGDTSFSRSDTLIEELRRLRDRGFIRNEGRSIGELPNQGNYSKFLIVTPDGREYLELCDRLRLSDEKALAEQFDPSQPIDQATVVQVAELVFAHILTLPQQRHLDRLHSQGPARYEMTGSMLAELRWLRALGMITSHGPLHDMPPTGDLKSVVILEPEGLTYLEIKQSLRESAPGKPTAP